MGVNQLLQDKIKDLDVIHKFVVGSRLYSDSPNDYDYLVIAENTTAHKIKDTYDNKTVDILILNPQEFQNKLNFIDTEIRHSLYNYQLTIKSNNNDLSTIDFQMYDPKIKKVYLKTIKDYYFETVGKLPHHLKYRFAKRYTHFFLILSFYENGSSELTNEILEKVNNLREQQNDYKDLVDWVDTTLYNLEIEEE